MDQAYVRPKAKGQKVKLKRFPQPFVLRPLTQEEVRGLYAVCRRKNGTIHRERYLTELMCRSIEKPNLQDQALQEAYGVLGADRLLCRMLLAGEFAYLAQQVRKVCGFEMEDPT